MDYDKFVATLWTFTSNRPGWMHFGLKTYEIPRNRPDSRQSGGFAKFYGIVDLRLPTPENADSSHFNPGRFDFCVVVGIKMQKLGR